MIAGAWHGASGSETERGTAARREPALASRPMSRLRLPPSRPRRRPQELSLAADESAPPSTLLPLGLQHAAMALGLSAYVLALAKGADFGIEETRTLLAVSIIAMALGTGLQAWGGRIGSGALIVHIPAPLMVTQAAPILSVTGPGGMTMLSIACALVALLVAPLTSRLRGLFPPIVAGLVVLIGGISLVQGAFAHAAGLGADLAPDGESLAVAAIAHVSHVLVLRLADRLKCGADPAGGRSFLRLHFDH